MPDSENAAAHEPFLAEFLRLNPAPCPACKYDLHGVTTSSCPKCRIAITLGLASRDAYRIAWGILLAILFIDATIGLFFATILFGLHSLQSLRASLWPAFIMFPIFIPTPIVLLLFRRPFFRLLALLQWTLVFFGCAATVAAFTALWLGLGR